MKRSFKNPIHTMKRLRTAISLVSTLPLIFVLTATVWAVDYNIYSSPEWQVDDAAGVYLGKAQNVCLDAGKPVNCPAGATLYMYPPGVNLWTAPLPSSNATWIW